MTLPVGLDLTGRPALVVGGGPAVLDGVRALVGAGADVRVVSPWLCEELEELAVSGGLSWSAHDYAGAAELDETWFVVVGTGDPATDDRVRADALSARVWCVDGILPRGGTATLPPTARATTPDGTVVVAAHSWRNRSLAADVARAVGEEAVDGPGDLGGQGLVP